MDTITRIYRSERFCDDATGSTHHIEQASPHSHPPVEWRVEVHPMLRDGRVMSGMVGTRDDGINTVEIRGTAPDWEAAIVCAREAAKKFRLILPASDSEF